MPTGRPSKLTKAVIDKANWYIDGGYNELEHLIPSHAGLAIVLKVAKSTIYKWAIDQPDRFSDILAKCNMVQEQILVTKGLSGEFNSNICKLVLGKHNYHDRLDVETNDKRRTERVSETDAWIAETLRERETTEDTPIITH